VKLSTSLAYTLPLPPEQGTGLGKPLKIIDHPVRDDIPICEKVRAWAE
jgi:hypothetical protein